MKIAYTYEIYKLNYSNGHFEVRYIPSDTALTAITWNVPVVFKEDGTRMELEENINMFAPYREWAAQKFMLENTDTLLNATGTITP